MDLADIAHYYNGHRKLFKHWQSILPAESILVVPYAELVRDRRDGHARCSNSSGVEWYERCLSFQDTQRIVVRRAPGRFGQKMYTHSVGRSEAYKKYIGPLKALRKAEAPRRRRGPASAPRHFVTQ